VTTSTSAEPFFLSGEFHYFRVPRAAWADHLRAMVDAGLDAASIYVPWNWHQASPEDLDFDGQTHPERDLSGALNAIAESGLKCVFRPGPFITAEWRNGGIPDWFLDQHPESLALDSWGRYAGTGRAYPVITYAHDTYRTAAEAWLRAVLAVARPHLASQGGPIVNVQLDDEPSYWQCIAQPLLVDYNPILVQGDGGPSRFADWLIKRLGSLAALNERYRTSWRSLEELQPPRQPATNLSDLPHFLDWFEFKLAQVNDYIGFLYGLAAGAGVDVRCSMLHPYLLPISALRCREYILEQKLPLQLTDECYLKLFSMSSAGEHKLGAVLSVHETYNMWRIATTGPPVAMELQGSLSSYLTPGAMEVLYALTVARGMRGINYYMMVGGANPRGFENGTGAEYDVATPISLSGERRPHYSVISRLSRMVKGWMSEHLADAAVLRDVWIGCYQQYEAALCSAPEDLLGLSGFADAFNAGDIGGAEVPSLASLFALNSISFGYIDLETATIHDLRSVRQLWVPGGPFLPRTIQERLVRYVEDGGHLVMMPGLPATDENMRPCSVLADFVLGEGTSLSSDVTAATALYGDGGEVVVATGTLRRWSVPDGTLPLLQDRSGAVCAFSRSVRGGTATVLGFNLRYQPTAGDGQHDFVRLVVKRGVGELSAWATPDPCAAFQLQGDQAGVVCVVNPVELPASAKVRYSTPEGLRRTLPLQLGTVPFPGRGARLLPVSVVLGNGATLAHATWELLDLQRRPAGALLRFSCSSPRGEVALEGVPGAPEVIGGRVLERTFNEGQQVLLLEATGPTVDLAIETRQPC
jgi:beta-galactosidase